MHHFLNWPLANIRQVTETNLHKAWSLCNIIFVILTCFHLTNFLENKNSAGCLLKTKWQRRSNFLVKLQWSVLELWTSVFSSATLFLEGSALNFLYPKKIVKWKQVKIFQSVWSIPKLTINHDSKNSSHTYFYNSVNFPWCFNRKICRDLFILQNANNISSFFQS